jgi:hypothetical protein
MRHEKIRKFDIWKLMYAHGNFFANNTKSRHMFREKIIIADPHKVVFKLAAATFLPIVVKRKYVIVARERHAIIAYATRQFSRSRIDIL